MDGRRSVAGQKLSSLRMAELDGIRAIAILMVLVWHYFIHIINMEPGSIAAYGLSCLRLTWSGVDLFFVLSGFLIGGILIDNRQAINYFSTFCVRRVFRIFPVYFVWLLLFAILILMMQILASLPALYRLFASPLPLWSYTTFTQNLIIAYAGNFGPGWMAITWSLAVEMQFYLSLPFLIRYLEPPKLPWLLVGFIVTAPLLRGALFYLAPSEGLAPYVLMPCRADALLAGGFFALVGGSPRFIA